MTFLGFCCRWCDLAAASGDAHPAQYAVVLALHAGVESQLQACFSNALVQAMGDGVGFVSLDHRFPGNVPWTRKLKCLARRWTNSFEFPSTDSFIAALKSAGERITWAAEIEMTQASYDPSEYEAIVLSKGLPAVIRHRRRAEVRFLFDSSYWFAAHCNDSLGMIDVLWRAIVWAARKPFPVLSVPPFVTARIDDCNGTRRNFSYVDVMNRHGILPHLGLFMDHIPGTGPVVETMRRLAADHAAQFAPHAFDPFRLIFFDRDKGPYPEQVLNRHFDQVEQRFKQWAVPRAATVNPHWGQVGVNCAPWFEQYGYRYTMLQFIPGEIISKGVMRHWSPRPFGNYAFVADHTVLMGHVFSVVSHWHPSHVLQWLGPEAYRVRLHEYSRHIDFLFDRTIFDPDRYYRYVQTNPIDERPWRSPARANKLSDAARTAAEAVRLALQASFYGCITTHEYSLAVLTDEELDQILHEFDRRLTGYERIPCHYDAVAAYMKTHAHAGLARCELERNVLRLSVHTDISAEAELLVTIYCGRGDRIEPKRIACLHAGAEPGTATLTWHGSQN